jgi:hypothetical protein
MSFSSASWTVPELCVWIAIRDKGALNNLVSIARKSIKSADLVHPGTYAARDEVLAAAQDGRITISCQREPNRGIVPPGTRDGRMALTKTFWSGAELDDATSHLGSGARWCVARPVHARDGRAYRELLVSRDEVLKEWPQRTSAVKQDPSPASIGPSDDQHAETATPTASVTLQSKFDAEKRRLIEKKEDHSYDAMTMWARSELEVDSKAAEELWENRSAEFPRRAGAPRKGRR